MAEKFRDTNALLWLENRHALGLKPGNLCPSQGRCLSREEEDQRQMEGQASWGSMSDCDRCPLIWSERPAWIFTHPTLQPAPPHHIRSWHSLMCGCLPSTGWMYQPHSSQAYSQREWQQDNATRRQWSGNHPVHQARKTPLEWINRKLKILPWTSARASTVDGWRFQALCSGCMDIFIDRMAGRIACIWWRDRHQPVDAIG